MLPDEDLSQPPKNLGAIEQQIDKAPRAKKKAKPQAVNLQSFHKSTPSMSSAAIYSAKYTQQKPLVVAEKGGVKDDFPAFGGGTGLTPISAPKQSQKEEKLQPQTNLLEQDQKLGRELADQRLLERAKRAVNRWDQNDQAGFKAIGLSEDRIAELMNWAGNLTTNSGQNSKFEVIREQGTGQYSGFDQVKLIKWFGGKKDGKNVTFHIAVRKV